MGETPTITVDQEVIKASLSEAKDHGLKEKTATETIEALLANTKENYVKFSPNVMEGLAKGVINAKHFICVDERPDLPRIAWMMFEANVITKEKYQEIIEQYNEEEDKEIFSNTFYTKNKTRIDNRPDGKSKENDGKVSSSQKPQDGENPYLTKNTIAIPQNTGALYKAIHQVLNKEKYPNIYQQFKITNSGHGKVSADILSALTGNTYTTHGSTHGHNDCGAAKTDKAHVLGDKGNTTESDTDYNTFVTTHKSFTQADHQILLGDHKPEGAFVFNDDIDAILKTAKSGVLHSLHHQNLEHAYFIYDGIAVKYLLYQMLVKEMEKKINSENEKKIIQEIKDFTNAVGNKITDYYGHLGGHLSDKIIPAITINTGGKVQKIGWIGGKGKDTTIDEK